MHSRRSAFSLVELSIVIVILGLLVGAILGGQSLIQAQRVRNVLTEGKTYAIAMQQFKDKYGYLPGDFSTATSVWGSDATYCTTAGNLSPGTCNGNGNGIVIPNSTASTSNESFQFWKQLMLAGMITGTYTGVSGPVLGGPPLNWAADSTPGVNIPRGSLPNSGWSIASFGEQSAGGNFYAGNYDNVLGLGIAVAGGPTSGLALTGKEAFDLDTKGDDGLPPSGSIRPGTNAYYGGTGNCTNDTNYVKSVATPSCTLFFLNTFMAPKQ